MIQPSRRDESEIEALRVDQYLESILVARDRGAELAVHDSRLDPGLQIVAERLSAELIRIHPSFRFEERLARRLAEVGDTLRLPAAAGGESRLPQLLAQRLPGTPGRAFERDFEPADLLDPAHPAIDDDSSGLNTRPLLIGGAITSAAISLAGAALVAWRLSRPAHPMVRAIRAAHVRSAEQGGLA